MSLWTKFIRALFLVKEIVAKNGKVHFRRYRLLALPWLRIYVHQICVSDYDAHFHDHPWHFETRLLSGSYREECTIHPDHDVIWSRQYEASDTVRHHAQDTHKLTLISKEVWTFVITWGKPREWGYRLGSNKWIDHVTYREMKNQGQFR